jgi:hypothetical protein
LGYLLLWCGINNKSLTNKKTKMKKVFALIAIVGFVACNNAETDAAKAIADSTTKANAEKVTADSIFDNAPDDTIADNRPDINSKKAAIDSAKAAMKVAEAPKH